MKTTAFCLLLLTTILCLTSAAQMTRPAASQPAWKLDAALPTVFLAGDSTAQPGDPLHTGWGKPFASYIDHDKANWVNAAIGGRSARTYITEGRWDRLAAALKPGDWVMIQFGQNDASPVDDATRSRGSLPGLGDETQEIDNKVTHKHEVVHTFGWYTKKMIDETKAKDAFPVLVALTPHNSWKNGHDERAFGHYNEWMKTLATTERIPYIDLTDMVVDRYEQLGQAEVKKFFPADYVHTGPEGAALNAEFVLAGMKALHRQLFIRLLSPAARQVNPATQPSVVLGKYSNSGSVIQRTNFLNLQMPDDPKLPSVILIGDSTVRNGRGDGGNGQWGWGEAIKAYFDPDKVNLVNRALGGTTSKSFMDLEWDGVMKIIKPGDYVLIQFGTNPDQGAPKGIGEETANIPNRGGAGTQVLHTYGWNLRKYISDIRAKGATPILCTLVPRNTWKDGKFVLNDVHAEWARQVAADQKVGLLDLNKVAGARYAALGEKDATAVFADQHVHTNAAGADILASVVVEELQTLPDKPVAGFLRDKPAPTW
jgi:lysophospholipase L1-like esterase